MGTEYKAVHEMLNEGHRPQAAGHVLSRILMLGFKCLAWINGVGVLLVVLCALAILPNEVSPYLLRMPLVAFLCGLALAGLGLLWVYMAQASLEARTRNGYGRPHWVPVLCVLAAYCVSMVMFAAGCWLLVGIGSWANRDWTHDFEPFDGSIEPQRQSAEPPRLWARPPGVERG